MGKKTTRWILDSLRRFAPSWVIRAMPRSLRGRLRAVAGATARALPSYQYLRDLMARYTVQHLVNVDEAAFRARIGEFLGMRDPTMEGYGDASRQRDLSIRFHWGHDHDFGSFSLRGRMGERHLSLLATFIDELRALPRDLTGKRVLDIGCWTGGTSLLLCAMGAEVVAVEEVKKYVDCLQYLKHAFAVENLQPRNQSLFDCVGPDFDDRFDYVLFAGVLYHVTDPILALRITFNDLVDGGTCLVETASHPSSRHIVAYEGPTRTQGGTARDQSRTGWNWFVPSPAALGRMLEDVGFTAVTVRRAAASRAVAVARRNRHVDMLRAGLSVRLIR